MKYFIIVCILMLLVSSLLTSCGNQRANKPKGAMHPYPNTANSNHTE